MVFLSSESNEKNFFYFVHPDWHDIGVEFTKQILSFLQHSSLSNRAKTGVIGALNRTLNVLGGAMYHLRNYDAFEEERRKYLESSAPPAKDPKNDRLVLMPELQCEMQAFLTQVRRGFDTLPDLIKPVMAIPKDLSFGNSGENILDVFQEILISDVADIRKHPVEKLIRLMEQGQEFLGPSGARKRPWLKFFAEFMDKAMREEEPGLAVFRVKGPPSGKVEVVPPQFSQKISLNGVLHRTWEAALDFHRDFYSLMVFWTLRPQFSFAKLPDEASGQGQKWMIVDSK